MKRKIALALLCLPALFIAPACRAEAPDWFVLNKEVGCERLVEVHDYLPYTRGQWTPAGMFEALNRQYRDARMTPFIDAVAEDRKESGEAETADAREYFSRFTKTNAILVTSKAGGVELMLFERSLCRTLGILPMEPEQWLAEPAPWQGKWQGGTEIPPERHYEASAQGWYEKPAEGWFHGKFVAEQKLKDTSFIEIGDDVGFYAGAQYKPEPGTRPYLVRGVMTGDVPRHRVIFKDGHLFVIAQGPRDGALRFAPLVVNLPSAPASVVVLRQDTK